jgi:hypothetical protein
MVISGYRILGSKLNLSPHHREQTSNHALKEMGVLTVLLAMWIRCSDNESCKQLQKAA